jgi:hypothetical protein
MRITRSQIRKLIKEAIAEGRQLYKVVDWAREGHRVVVDGKTAWSGLGNRAGLDSYADKLIDEKWEKSGDKFQKKLEALPPGSKIELFQYYNVTRDRGKWRRVKTIVTEQKGE